MQDLIALEKEVEKEYKELKEERKTVKTEANVHIKSIIDLAQDFINMDILNPVIYNHLVAKLEYHKAALEFCKNVLYIIDEEILKIDELFRVLELENIKTF